MSNPHAELIAELRRAQRDPNVLPTLDAGAVERLTKRAHEIETHTTKVPGYYPEAIQHAADLRALLSAVSGSEGGR